MQKKIFIILFIVGLLIAVVLFIATKTITRPSSSTTNTISKLHVLGNRIVTEDEQTIRLRGVNTTDPLWLEKLDFKRNGVPDNRFKEIETDFARIKALGANVVRLPIYPGYYFLVGGEKYLTTYVDLMIDLAERNGLYAIISYHAIGRPGGWYSSDSDKVLPDYPAKLYYTDSAMAVQFWNTVAARYGKKEHVLFEIYNEPMDETANYTWANWRPTGELLIATIRQHSKNIILGSGPKYSGDLSDVPKNPYSDSNLVYVAHIYPGNVPKGEDQVAAWEKSFGFLASTYPVIVSEWGFHNGGDVTTNGTLQDFGKPLIDYLDQKKIHWVAFVYLPPDAEPPMLEPDWTTLTQFGKFVKKRLNTEP